MTARSFLIRGLIAGFVAGVIGFAVAHTVGEPPVDDAIAIEEAGAPADHHDSAADGAPAAHSHNEETALVSRDTQSTWGLATATLVYGTAIGGIFGLIAAFAMGRLGQLRPTVSTGLVIAIGFVGVILLPYLKYPPNPPAVGNPDTIGTRTGEYFLMMLISVAVLVAATIVASKVVPMWGQYRGLLMPAGVAGVVILVAALLLPVIDEVPDTFPADVLWRFRLASLTTQAAIWATLGIVMVGLLGKPSRDLQQAQERREFVRAG